MASIAVVDDEANIRETVEFVLRREGYEVQSYPDGLEAWTAFQNALPEVVILDIPKVAVVRSITCRRSVANEAVISGESARPLRPLEQRQPVQSVRCED